MKSPATISESRLIERFVRAIETAGVRAPGLVTGVGDDAAVFRGNSGEDFVVTQDVLVEGRHFKREWFGGRELGRRLASVNLSDVAAMGARPLYGLFSLVLPADTDPAYVEQISKGIVSRFSEFGAALIGGNVSGTGGPLTCDLTVIGACPRGKAWLRRARSGDAIVIAGRLGEAAAGLEMLRAGRGTSAGRGGRLVSAFKRPRPLLAVPKALRGTPGVRGAIDVSDGLSTDVIHVCEPSGVGCEIDADALPASRPLAAFCKARGADPVDWMMRGGDAARRPAPSIPSHRLGPPAQGLGDPIYFSRPTTAVTF
jgi:thiamine-monophosphate kinase